MTHQESEPINKPTIQPEHKLQVNGLFGNEEEDPPTSNPATIISAIIKFGGLFSDNKGHVDLFGKRKLQKKRPAGAVPLFG